MLGVWLWDDNPSAYCTRRSSARILIDFDGESVWVKRWRRRDAKRSCRWLWRCRHCGRSTRRCFRRQCDLYSQTVGRIARQAAGRCSCWRWHWCCSRWPQSRLRWWHRRNFETPSAGPLKSWCVSDPSRRRHTAVLKEVDDDLVCRRLSVSWRWLLLAWAERPTERPRLARCRPLALCFVPSMRRHMLIRLSCYVGAVGLGGVLVGSERPVFHQRPLLIDDFCLGLLLGRREVSRFELFR